MPRLPLVEACCDSVQTARAAQQYGAGRVELCGLGDGGTTPSHGMIARCRDTLTIPLHVMIRPHTHSFLYDEDDMDVEQQGHLEELQDVMFKVKLDKAEPQGVKISKKNMCTVTIVQNEDAQKE